MLNKQAHCETMDSKPSIYNQIIFALQNPQGSLKRQLTWEEMIAEYDGKNFSYLDWCTGYVTLIRLGPHSISHILTLAKPRKTNTK